MGIINREGALFMATGIDNSGYRRDANEAEGIINGLSNHAKKAGMLIGSMFAVTGAKDFVTQMIKVRGQFQQLEIAFTTMLKSEESAMRLMGELTDFAARTPFGLESAATGAKQLLAYGSAAEDVIDELTMLGDVAAGTGQQIGDLVYLYGTLRTQGRAYLMDIRQFAGRGIPIYDELAKVLKVNVNQVNEFVSAGKVGFKEVEQAFKNMTSSGGLYGGLMEKQSSSVLGRMEQLQDAVQSMFNEIGQSSEGLVYSAIDGISALVENYEEIGEILAELIVSYGAYKAVVISVAALGRVTATAGILEESKSLEVLLTTEQKEAIAKQGLVKGTYEYATAVKSAAIANKTAAKEQVAALGQEASAQKAAMIAAKEKVVVSAQLVAQRKAELAALIGTAEAEKIASLQKKMAIESEKQSRAALLAVQLQERKNSAIQQAQALKEAGASQQRIIAKNREISSIHKKNIAAKAEEVQYARNVAAIRSEIAAVSGSITSKKIDTAQRKLDTAVMKENTAITERNAAMKAFYGKK